MSASDPDQPRSMPAEDLPRMTVDEYLRFEERSQERHEYVDGHLFVVAGPTARHHLIVSNLHLMLSKHLEGSRCRVFTNSFMLRLEDLNRFYYPDLLVTCGQFDLTANFTTSPVLVIEVLSPSTAATDRREKLIAYEQIHSLQEYVIVYQSMQRIDLYRKEGSQFSAREIITSGSFELRSLPVGALSVPIKSVYEQLDWGHGPATDPIVREEAVTYTW